jgi:hypothetical protein
MTVLDTAIGPDDTGFGPDDVNLAATPSAISSEPGEDHRDAAQAVRATENRHVALRSWPVPLVARVGTSLAVVSLGADLLWKHTHQLDHGIGLGLHASAGWALVGVVMEAASFLSFGLVQQRLLHSRSAQVSLAAMLRIAVAANGISNVLPGGSALAAAWTWKQFRSRGANRSVASWVLIVSGIVSSIALGFMIIAGIEIAGSRGPLAFLRPLAIAAAAAAVGGGLLAHKLRDRTDKWTKRRPRLSEIRAALALGEPSAADWAIVTIMSVLNWTLDLGCLLACITAIGAPMHWSTVIIAYSLSQLLNAIPLTPGGLGIIEAGIAALLVAYGMTAADAIAVVIVYRIISFWLPTPIGLTIWLRMHLSPNTAKPLEHERD